MAFIFGKNHKKKEDSIKYNLGMKNTRKSLVDKIKGLFSSKNQIDDDLFDELTDILIMADIGVETSLKFIDTLKDDNRVKGLSKPEELVPVIQELMKEEFFKEDVSLTYQENELNVYLFVGVNGAGKTTSIGKLAYRLKEQGLKVLLAAADTFRAGAVDQLVEWSKRVNCDIVTKPEGTDPSSVVYDAVKKSTDEHYDVLLCDTAGRLQTKVNLMTELTKMRNVVDKVNPGSLKEVLLVIDATTGQNGLSQAKAFLEATQVTGIVLSKLDGTSKGGIALSIIDSYKIPVKLVGLGEKIDDLEDFDCLEYINGLLGDF